MTDQVFNFKKARHSELRPGVEFTAFLSTEKRGKARLRFQYARSTPKGWELTGWDGRIFRTVQGDNLLKVHRTTRIPKM